MGPIWGRQGLGGSHVGLMNFAIWETLDLCNAWVTAMLYKLSYYIGSRYNGTRLNVIDDWSHITLFQLFNNP